MNNKSGKEWIILWEYAGSTKTQRMQLEVQDAVSARQTYIDKLIGFTQRLARGEECLL